MRSTRTIVSLFSVALLASIAVPSSALAAETDLIAHLNGSSVYPAASGRSEYESDSDGRDLEVTVTNVIRLAGKRVTVYVSTHKVGTMLVSSTGRAHREWDTERGQAVPAASVGSPVKVRTSSGTLVVLGKYHLDPDN